LRHIARDSTHTDHRQLSLPRRIIFGRNPRRTAVRVLALTAVAFITFTWVLIPIRTDGPSMLPTYRSNALNLVNRWSYTMTAPARGDVVAIRLAGPSVVFVKRIVGLPGERLAIVDGVIHVNGAPLDEPYVEHRRKWERAEVTLGAQEYFAVGDNRGMSQGFHKFGVVDRERILGKVVF
jgi:signal peptidase I